MGLSQLMLVPIILTKRFTIKTVSRTKLPLNPDVRPMLIVNQMVSPSVEVLIVFFLMLVQYATHLVCVFAPQHHISVLAALVMDVEVLSETWSFRTLVISLIWSLSALVFLLQNTLEKRTSRLLHLIRLRCPHRKPLLLQGTKSPSMAKSAMSSMLTVTIL